MLLILKVFMINYKEISNQYKYKTELHAHTSPVSTCSEVSPEEIVSLYRSIGCNTLTVTNHLNPLWTPDRTDEYLSGYYDTKAAADGTELNVVLGVEIRFTENDNDYLVYGVRPDEIDKMIRLIPYGIADFYKEIKNQSNLILQAHPFRRGMVLASLDTVDGIETLNMHPHHNSRVAIACQYARENKLVVSGGTDFHHVGHQGMCLCRTENRIEDSFDIPKILKSQDYLFDIGGALVIPEQF